MTREDLEAFDHDAPLRDGRTVRIRLMRDDDLDQMMALWSRLSEETIRMRFFAPRTMSREEMRYFVEVDQDRRFAAVADVAGRIVGVARFDRLPEDPSTAEFAVAVEDAEQGRGIGTALLRALVRAAERLGVRSLAGDVLRENEAMLRVMRDAGLEPSYRDTGDVVATSFRANPSASYLLSLDEQQRTSAVAAAASVLRPRSVAVVGADERTRCDLLLARLRAGGFGGGVAWGLDDLPGPPELVVACGPPSASADLAERAGRAGASALVLLAPGQQPRDASGEALEVARRHGLRLLGPHSAGVLHNAEDVRLHATASPALPLPGGLALVSRAGTAGLTLLEAAARRGLGVRAFACVGDEADLGVVDLLQYWEADRAVGVVGLSLDGLRDPRALGRIARRMARSTPIVAVVDGPDPLDRDGGPEPGDDALVDALLRQSGIIGVDSAATLLDVARLLSAQPLPRGRGVAVLADDDDAAAEAASALREEGLEPVVAHPEPAALRALAERADAVVALLGDTPPEGLLAALAEATAGLEPAVPALVVRAGAGAGSRLETAEVPAFASTGEAARALAAVARYARWRDRAPARAASAADLDAEALRALLDDTVGGPGTARLDAGAAGALLAAAGVATTDAAEAGEATALRVRLRHDRAVGAILAVGPPGAEQASVVGLHPLAGDDVTDLLAGLRRDPRLDGADLAGLGSLLGRLGALVEAVPDLEALDLDPVLVGPHGLAVAGSVVTLAPAR
ncbi:MAG: GNAT family N-acetyltransferase [Egibacteraceae bacterium]